MFVACNEQKDTSVFPNDLEIQLSEEAVNNLNALKDDAIQTGVILDRHKEKEKGIIHYGDLVTDADIRLKGDWTDHLKGEKTSYRIKLDNGKINETDEFSIQDPYTRSGIHEWLIHKILEREGFLTTAYTFLSLYENGASKGIYAFEEHFGFNLLNRSNRRSAPILKLSEDGLWSLRSREGCEESALPAFSASIIEPFEEKKVLKDPVLSGQFNKALRLFHRYINYDEQVDQIFDLNLMGKYYALMDWADVKHSFIWHNLRFYFNPETELLEPVAFDLEPFADAQHFPRIFFILQQGPTARGNFLEYPLLRDSTFRASYFYHLSRYTSDLFFDSVLAECRAELDRFEDLFRLENESFTFDTSLYYTRNRLMRDNISRYTEVWDRFLLQKDFSIHAAVNEGDYNADIGKLFVRDISLNAYLRYSGDSVSVLDLENYHLHPLIIHGYSTKSDKNHFIAFSEAKKIPAYRDGKAGDFTLKMSELPEFIYFSPENNPEVIVKKRIIPWMHPNLIPDNP